MPNSSLLPLAALAAVTALFGTALFGAAAASEYRCERADQTVRRVEIAVEDAATGVPCEVIYWKDQEEPGVRRVLWNAQTDAAFCEGKAKELVATLEEGGWDCAAPGPTSRPATREATAQQPPAPPPSAPDAPAQAESPAAASPTTTAEPRPAPAPGSVRSGAAERPVTEQNVTEQKATEQKATEPTISAPKAGEPKAGEQEEPSIRAALAPERPSQPALAPAPGEPADSGPKITALPETTALDSIIEQNLVRLNDGVEGEFAAEVGRYGDLDGDGLEDGLVFFTYQSERLGQARFIAAYLYDGDSYTLAATKPVAGSDDRVQSAEVEAIEGGVISLRLNVLEPGDAACCPSGSRHQTLVLQDGQLIEVSKSASPPSDNPS